MRVPAPRAIDAPIAEGQGEAHEAGPDHREQLPAPGPVAEREQHLRQPLLVGPGASRPP